MALDVMMNQILLCLKPCSTVIHTESSHKITHKIIQQRLHTAIVFFLFGFGSKVPHPDPFWWYNTYSCQASSAWNWRQGNGIWAAGGVFPRGNPGHMVVGCRYLLFFSKGVPLDQLSSNDSKEWIDESHFSTGAALKSHSWLLWPFLNRYTDSSKSPLENKTLVVVLVW